MIQRLRPLALAATLFGLGACASREAPTRSPKAISPASLVAAEVTPAPVTRALEGDPPPPGEPAGAWPALGGGSGKGGHDHH